MNDKWYHRRVKEAGAYMGTCGEYHVSAGKVARRLVRFFGGWLCEEPPARMETGLSLQGVKALVDGR